MPSAAGGGEEHPHLIAADGVAAAPYSLRLESMLRVIRGRKLHEVDVG